MREALIAAREALAGGYKSRTTHEVLALIDAALAQLHSSIKSAASGGSDLHRLIVGMADRLLLSLGLRCGRRRHGLLRDDDGLRRQFEEGRRLSPKQIEALDNIWEKATAKG